MFIPAFPVTAATVVYVVQLLSLEGRNLVYLKLFTSSNCIQFMYMSVFLSALVLIMTFLFVSAGPHASCHFLHYATAQLFNPVFYIYV